MEAFLNNELPKGNWERKTWSELNSDDIPFLKEFMRQRMLELLRKTQMQPTYSISQACNMAIDLDKEGLSMLIKLVEEEQALYHPDDGRILLNHLKDLLKFAS